MNKVELLSPAGNFECLKAAINNGADAVYLGGTSFSARAFANNFNNEDIVEAINYAHLRNIKVYVTLNTLLNEKEIDNAYKLAEYLYRNNVDGLIIQDLGLFYRLRKDYPDYELHASTQMHIHNLQGVKNAKLLGFKRVVIARESSLDFIKEACKQDVEIECFVHGAICVSYSGQCLLSSVTKNRSANKGMCAQCCRLKYRLYENNRLINTDTEYLLSPKDMCLINDIPSLIEAGVKSFKIEGRMKSPAYVGYITKMYRKAIDSYYNNKKFELTKDIVDNMKLLFNRGFSNEYLHNSNLNMFSNIRPNHMGIEIGKVIDVKRDKVKIKLTSDINQFDGIRIISSNDTGTILNKIYQNGLLVNEAKANSIIEIDCSDSVIVNDTVVKTLDHNLEKEINSTSDIRRPIKLDITIEPNKRISINCYINDIYFEFSSNELVNEAINRPLDYNDIINCFNKVDKHPYMPKINLKLADNSYISLKILNDIRRSFYDSLDEFIINSFKRRNPSYLILNENFSIKDVEFDITKLNPIVNNFCKYNNDYNLVSEFGGLLLKGNKDAYYTLNVANSYAYEFLLKLGFSNIILSTELNSENINDLVDGINSRLAYFVKPYVVSRAHRTLMYVYGNPFSKYIKSLNSDVKLSDSINVFNVIFNKEYCEIVENDTYIFDDDSIKNIKYIDL